MSESPRPQGGKANVWAPLLMLGSGVSQYVGASFAVGLFAVAPAISVGWGRIASAARADYAEAAAAVLTSPDQSGKVYELAGDEAYTLAGFAAELSRQSGKAIPYVDLPESDYKAALVGAGLPEPIAALLADSDTGASKGGLFDDTRQLSTLIGRPTTPLAVSMRAALA